MLQKLKEEIDTFVRDLTRVAPLPKSEVRRRIQEIIDLTSDNERKRMIDMIELWSCSDSEKYRIKEDIFMFIKKRENYIKKQI